MERSELLLALHQGKCKILFKKADNTERTMICSLSTSLIGTTPSDTEKTKKKPNPDVQPVFDLEQNAWRSFRWDSLISAEVIV